MKAQRNLNSKATKQRNNKGVQHALSIAPRFAGLEPGRVMGMTQHAENLQLGSLAKWFLTLCIFFLPNLTQAQLTYSHYLQFRQFEAFAVQNPALPNFIYNNKATNYPRRFETSPVAAFAALSKTPRYAEFNELGWFCTLDLKMDLKMKLPLRFRLGSLEEVNRKEGKD